MRSDPTAGVPAARRINGAAGMLAGSVLLDSAVEHYRGSFQNEAMYTPLAISLLTLAASLHGANDRRPSGHRARQSGYALAVASCLAGLGFHLYNITKRPGGFSWLNLFYSAPLGAPVALSLSGLLGAAAERVRHNRRGITPRLLGLPAGRALAAVTGLGIAGTVGEVGLLHFRGAYHDPFMFLPVTVPPVAAVLLANAVLGPPRPKRGFTRSWLRLTAALGLVGVGFHAFGVARNIGGWRNWSQNVLNGPPLPAPPALISRDGSVDFLCWPRFDSDACFCALLGDERNGFWRIAPEAQLKGTQRHYRGDTLVLETTFDTISGAVRLLDFMPMRGHHPSLVRIVEGARGRVPMRLELRLRFNYGLMPPWSRRSEDCFVADVGPDLVAFQAPTPIDTQGPDASARFAVAAGQRFAFELSYGSSTEPPPKRLDPEIALKATIEFWEDWIGRFDKPCRWPAAVRRSLITLKAMVHQRTGGLIAAATLGLPEVPGGSMNWDYRYCWLRDATFTLTALLNAGYREEATRWRDWILRAVAGRPEKLQVAYHLDGGRRLSEWAVNWLPGYEASKPVLVGNEAATERQLDVYGELLDSMHVAAHGGVARVDRGIQVETALVQHLETVWDQPSSDIWESRGNPQHYTYSQAMAWVGLTQFLRGACTHRAAGDDMIGRLDALRGRIHEEVCRRGYDPGRGHFSDYYGSKELDASLLLLPLVNFLPVDDPRMAGTIAAVERELMDGGLVRRKPAKHDGHDEGAFLVCSCWLADCMAKQGRHDDARAMLERVIDLSNDVSLLSEEYHVPTRRLIGNIPQALTHLGVVNTALGLSGPTLRRGA